MTIYIDSYFLLNMVMNWLVLMTVCNVFNYKKKRLRIGIAAAIGSLYACIVLIFFDKYNIIESFLTYVIICAILCIVSFGYKSIRHLIQSMSTLYAIIFCFSGLVNTLYLRGIIKSAYTLIIISFLGIIIINYMIKSLRAKMNFNTHLTKVKIQNGKNKVIVNGLFDTGNSLKEPITGKAVSVLSKEMSKKLLEGMEAKQFVIPYSSIGKEHGLLMGFIVDYMEINNGNNKTVIIKPIIAQYDGAFSGNKDYELLLNPLLKEGM